MCWLLHAEAISTEENKIYSSHQYIQANNTIMLLLFLNFALFSINLFLVPSVSQSEEGLQLLQFRETLTQDSQLLLPWNRSTSLSAHCQWTGISCYSNTDFRVESVNLTSVGLTSVLENSISYLCELPDLITLDLSGNYFNGTIPTLIGNCSRLSTILLHTNGLSGAIPSQLFESKSLQKLNLGYNQLSGSIPVDIINCKNLEYLGLYNNFLTGEIPTGLFSLQNLSFLDLNSNNLTGVLPGFPSSCSLSEIHIQNNSFYGSLPLSLNNCRNITILFASDNNLGGLVPPNIFQDLQKLEKLYLYGNNFEGQIPDSISGLTNLKELLITNNRFNGSIPEDIGQSYQLTYLDMSSNELTGKIPASVGNLRSLEYLLLLNNTLNGSIPPEIRNCSSLVQLRLDGNLIQGVLPNEICELQNLEVLFVSRNQIDGSIPPCIERLTSLGELALNSNNFTGVIPSGISNLTNLTFLSLAHNNLSGDVPSDLGKNIPFLSKVDLTGNRLTGRIPSGICSGDRLLVLTLGDNQFNGSFPTEITKCKSLYRVILRNNLLRGSMPDDMETTASISYFDLRGNLLQGKIPAAFGFWRNLSMIDLSGNGFIGSVPKEFGRLQKLEELRMPSNRLTGEIPPELTLCPKITELDLSQNNLSGSIPSQLLSSLSLQIIRLQENKFTGVIPDTFSSSQGLQEMQLGDNMLEGSIPCSLSQLHQFSSVLNLSSNRLSGEIPGCLGNLDMLEILDISSNNFSGEIPSQVDNMRSLSQLNISFNQLSGHVPARWAKILEKEPGASFGNPKLCLSTDETRHCGTVRKSRKNIFGILAGVVAGSIFLAACLLASLCVVERCIRRSQPLTPHHLLLDDRPRSEELPDGLSFLDIVRGTEGWSDKYVIGRGKHGTVYRTESAKSGKQWAVKKVDLSETNFSSEQRTLSMVKHRNVLRMGGYSVRNGFGFIVTDYMPEGTLYDLLHDRKPQVSLSWEIRHQIALGIAQGLSYLHHDCVPQIIHRDIKSDNILLDAELEPKIGDFGLALLDDQETDESTTLSTIVGTLGYIAPENAYSTKLTDKRDIYSYGVILLELLCRKLPVDPSFDEGLDIVSWVLNNMKNQNDFSCFMDEEIQYWDSEDRREAVVVMTVALQCTKTSPDARPCMRDVVASLIKLNCQKSCGSKRAKSAGSYSNKSRSLEKSRHTSVN